MSVDKGMFKKHVNEAPFQNGVDQGRWEILSNEDFPEWPKVIIRIRARAKKDNPDFFSFRFDLNDYPSTPPTCCIWDEDKKAILENSKWPKGATYVSKVFNPGWKKEALYCPCDRIAIAGHDNWKTAHPDYYWRSDFTIVKYLQFIYDLLNSDDYANS